jgi:hypothetical protein
MMLRPPKNPTPEQRQLFGWIGALLLTNTLLWVGMGALILCAVILYAIIHYWGVGR